MTCKVLAAAVLLAVGIGSLRANTLLWSEGFEGYHTDAGQTYGSLDKNASGGANIANNGVGNPWFGPDPNNGWVTKEMTNPDPTNMVVTPHSGQYMMRGNRNSSGWFNGGDLDIDHVNIAYRFHGGTPFTNNFAIDWWFYDALGGFYYGDIDLGPGCFGDHAGIEFSTLAPSNNDYATSDGHIGTPGQNPIADITDAYQVTARLGIGSCEVTPGYDETVYHVQVLGASDPGTFGSVSDYFGNGWFNTTVTRSVGWHHAAISVDANNLALLSIDDTVVLKHDTGAPNGFNVFTTTELQQTPDSYNQSAYYDDITLSLITGPKITKTSIDNGTNLVIQGTDGLVGWTAKVLTSTTPTGPKSGWTPIATNLLSATGPFTIVATNAVSPGRPKAFFVLQCSIQP